MHLEPIHLILLLLIYVSFFSYLIDEAFITALTIVLFIITINLLLFYSIYLLLVLSQHRFCYLHLRHNTLIRFISAIKVELITALQINTPFIITIILQVFSHTFIVGFVTAQQINVFIILIILWLVFLHYFHSEN